MFFGLCVALFLLFSGLWHLRKDWYALRALRHSGWQSAAAEVLQGGVVFLDTALQSPSVTDGQGSFRKLFTEDEAAPLPRHMWESYAAITFEGGRDCFSGGVSLKVRLSGVGSVQEVFAEPYRVSLPVSALPALTRDSLGRPHLYHRDYNDAVKEAILAGELSKWLGKSLPVRYVAGPSGRVGAVQVVEMGKDAPLDRSSLKTGLVLAGAGAVILLLMLL